MDLERQQDGRLHFSLGKVERWVVGTCAFVLVASFGWIFNRITSQLDTQGKAIAAMATQQAVMNNQLVTLNLQLADVPSMTSKLTEHEVRLDRVEADVKELRSTRGLR